MTAHPAAAHPWYDHVRGAVEVAEEFLSQRRATGERTGEALPPGDGRHLAELLETPPPDEDDASARDAAGKAVWNAAVEYIVDDPTGDPTVVDAITEIARRARSAGGDAGEVERWKDEALALNADARAPLDGDAPGGEPGKAVRYSMNVSGDGEVTHETTRQHALILGGLTVGYRTVRDPFETSTGESERDRRAARLCSAVERQVTAARGHGVELAAPVPGREEPAAPAGRARG